MKSGNGTWWIAVFCAVVLILAGANLSRARELSQWLAAGPVLLPHVNVDAGLDGDPVKNLLEGPPVDPYEFWPSAGEVIELSPGRQTVWRASSPMLPLSGSAEAGEQAALLASYLRAPAWQTGKLIVQSDAPYAVFLDGESAMSRADYKESAPADTHAVTLGQTHHRLFIITVLPQGETPAAWKLSVGYELDEGQDESLLPTPTLDPKHPYDLIDYYRSDIVSGLKISPDGRWLALDLGRRDRRDDSVTDRLEVWDTKANKCIWTYRAAKGVGNIAWAPGSDRLLFKSDEVLFVWHREENLVERIAAGFEDGGDFRWSADGNGLYYLKAVKPKDLEEDYQVMWGLRDRWDSWRENQSLRYYGFDNGLDVELLVLEYKAEAWDISRDGRHIAFIRTLAEAERPFELMDVLVFDLQTGEAKSVYQGRFQRDEYARMAFSGDGSWIVFAAPVSEVSGNEAGPPYINTSHLGLYVLDVKRGEAHRVAPGFEKAVDFFYYRTGYDCDFVWHADGYVAFAAAWMKQMYYCTWTPGTDEISSRMLETSAFSYLSIATGKGAGMVAYQGDVLNDQVNLHTFDTKKSKPGITIEINSEQRKLTQPAPKVVDYDFVNSDGVKIYGFLYYPLGYLPTKSYPLVVDTYGGVIGFGDSWLWTSEVMANRGYFVYVPIPRGAVGYGQSYADPHVNDWGTLTSRDMNEGVRDVVKNVPGVDGGRCGFVSGSYGGFLAMYLVSMPHDSPDYYPYATAISDYGISDLASYWGIGNWGVFYSEKASAGSFPWNKPEWYVKHSPLYQADNVTVPLLLLHGESDVNVPSGESEQMYSALKVLDREVMYIRWPGEGHGIADKRAHYLETKRIHMEWFDKYLRDQPGAWDQRMKEEFQK